MGIGSNSLDFIRQFFSGSEYERPPFIPPSGSYQGGTGNSPYFSYNIQQGMIQGISDALRLDVDLVGKYVDYEDQDDSPLVSSALDIYADDSSQVSQIYNKSIWVECKNEEIRADLEYMLHNVVRIEEHLWGWLRTLCKYGNWFSENVIKDKAGIVAVNPLPAPTVRRIEIPQEIGSTDPNREHSKDAMGYIYDPRGMFSVKTKDFIDELEFRSTGVRPAGSQQIQGAAVFEGWEVNHMRLNGKNSTSIYGQGIGDPARWVFKRLLMLEDSLLVHRLTRSPSRYAFYVDVSNIPPQEVKGYLNNVKQVIKKDKFVNPQNNKSDLKYNVMGSMDDFFLPVRDGKESTRVESLAGPVYDSIGDVQYFENKLFAALKVPKPFLTYEESTAKTNLSAEDARFARTVMRVQREFRHGVKKICRVHLAAKGINPDSVEFDISMTVPSAIFELAQLEIRKAELELVDAFKDIAGMKWGMLNIMGFSEQQIQEIARMKAAEDDNNGNLVIDKEKSISGVEGSIEKLASERGSPSSSSSASSKPIGATASKGQENASKFWNSDKLLTEFDSNNKLVKEMISEKRHKDKNFDGRMKRVESLLSDIRQAIPKK